MKRLLSLIIILCLVLSVAPVMASEGGDLNNGVKWEFEDGVLEITGNGYIRSESMFYYPWGDLKDQIEEVIIGDGIELIGTEAFDGCINLKKVTIGRNVTDIEQFAFYGCENLTEVYYKSLRGISIGNGNGKFVYADAYGDRGKLKMANLCGYNKDGGLTMELDETGTLTISGEGPLRNKMLMGNLGSYIRRVVIEEGTTSICDDAFKGCDAMVSVTIPSTVETIGQRAFAMCSSLESVYLPDSYIMRENYELSNSVFLSCRSLTEYVVSDTNPNYVSINGVLYSKDKTTLLAYPPGNKRQQFTVPSHVTKIGNGAFYFNRFIKTLKLHATLTSLGEDLYFDDIIIYYGGTEAEWANLMKKNKNAIDEETVKVYCNTIIQDEISVLINGNRVEFDQMPVIESGRTLVPLRAIFEALGATVDWDQATQTVISIKDGVEITLTVGEDVFYVDGREVGLDVPAKVVNGRTLVPARAVAESFGCKVEWDNDNRAVVITK